MKRSLLGTDAASRPPKHSLATNLALLRNHELAAPYLRHIGLAAPYLAAAIPDILPGLLLPSIASPKPPAARKKPTRTNLFKASLTMSSKSTCNGCVINSGTIIVTHFGTVPPITSLCYAVTPEGCPCEVLVPYQVVPYQEDPARQFTYAANAASSVSLEITSFAANNPLNGQATSAHVMDLDDICTYTAGTFELRSTTSKDAVSSTSLANGLVGIMGPESFTETLLHPYHCGTKTYPGWSIAVNMSNTDATVNRCQFDFCKFTEHRWFVNTTFHITAVATLEAKDHVFDTGGMLNVYLTTIKGMCPPKDISCASDALHKWATNSAEPQLVASDALDTCATKEGSTSLILSKKDKHTAFLEARKERIKNLNELKCKKPDPPDTTCVAITEVDDCADTTTSPRVTCCRPQVTSGGAYRPPNGGGFNRISTSGMYTTCETENATGILVDWSPCGNTPTLKCVHLEVRTLVHDPQAQFGPAVVTRLEGITDDIVIQLNVRSAVSGIQTGEARSVAPPTAPSMLGLGEEDAVLAQAAFDDPNRPIARIMTSSSYRAASEHVPTMTRESVAQTLEAAPIGDTIRNIAGTISKIGHGLGGPFGAIGDVLGSVGNIAGGIGDAIGSIFSAPKHPRLAAPRFAAPEPLYKQIIIAAGLPATAEAAIIEPTEGATRPTIAAIEAAVKKHASWSVALASLLRSNGPIKTDTMQAFPWVDPSSNTAGISNIFVTDQPMTLPDRAKPKYVKYSNAALTYYFDEYLTAQNDRPYIIEAQHALAYSGRAHAFLTTDSTAYIFGDSFAASVAAACLQPSPQAAVTGGFQAYLTGTAEIIPVGLTEIKIQAALEAGLVLVTPSEDSITYLRANSAGTQVVTINDIIAGLLTNSPDVIAVETPSDLIAALSFVRSTASTPFGQEEITAKQEAVDKGMAKSREIEAQREQFKLPPEPTEEQLAEREAYMHTLDLGGLGIVPVPILSKAWWELRRDIITRDQSAGGLGIPFNKIELYLSRGDVHKLQGIAMGLVSREMSAARKAQGGRGKQPPRQPRLPPYKRPPSSQIGALIERLRQRPTPMEQEPSTTQQQRPARGRGKALPEPPPRRPMQ